MSFVFFKYSAYEMHNALCDKTSICTCSFKNNIKLMTNINYFSSDYELLSWTVFMLFYFSLLLKPYLNVFEIGCFIRKNPNYYVGFYFCRHWNGSECILYNTTCNLLLSLRLLSVLKKQGFYLVVNNYDIISLNMYILKSFKL